MHHDPPCRPLPDILARPGNWLLSSSRTATRRKKNKTERDRKVPVQLKWTLRAGAGPQHGGARTRSLGPGLHACLGIWLIQPAAYRLFSLLPRATAEYRLTEYPYRVSVLFRHRVIITLSIIARLPHCTLYFCTLYRAAQLRSSFPPTQHNTPATTIFSHARHCIVHASHTAAARFFQLTR